MPRRHVVLIRCLILALLSILSAGRALAQKHHCSDCPPPPPPPVCTSGWCPSTISQSGGTVVDIQLWGCLSNCNNHNDLLALVQGGFDPGLYRSTDAGHTFAQIAAFAQPYKLGVYEPASGTNGRLLFVATSSGLYQSSDLSRFTLLHSSSGLPNGPITWVTGTKKATAGFDGPLYASPGLDSPVYRSADGGATWQPVSGLYGTPRAIAAAPDYCPDPAYPNKVFAAGIDGQIGVPPAFSRSDDGGLTWIDLGSKFPSVTDVEVRCLPASPSEVYITGDTQGADAVARSADAGATFAVDDVGIASCCAGDIDTFGEIVGTANGLYSRSYGPVGTAWTSYYPGLIDPNVQEFYDLSQSPFYVFNVVRSPSGVYFHW